MRLEDVLVTMAGRLVENGIVTDVANFVDGLLERERMSPTSLGEGVAIPHLRNPEHFPIIRPLLLVATCPGGIDWNAPDGEKVRLVMLPIAGSEVTHLRILSSVAGYLRRHEGLVDRLVSAVSAAELYALLYKRA
jgi:mannitol/fructose-specific phosphotransferase system IIA component (Ntr-type)